MDHSSNPITVLTDEQSWARLEATPIGRLITNVAGIIDVTPINFVVDDHSLVFRTAPGDKLAKLVINDEVVFEADEIGAETAWSVIVRGHAAPLELEEEIHRAEELPLRPFVPTLKPVFVRITPTSISGRAFVTGEETRREDQQDG